MDASSISVLFNRAVLDTLVGFVFLVWCQIFGELGWDVSLIHSVESSSVVRWAPVMFLVAGFLSGTLIDRFAFLIFDRRLFGRAFQSRFASFDIPAVADSALKFESDGAISRPGEPKPGELIDDSRADVISAVFWTKARSEALTKRAELVANFQFDSNLLFATALYVPVLPGWLLIRRGDWFAAVLAFFFLIALCALLWRMSLAAIGRIHTHENLVVFGLIVDGWRCARLDSTHPEDLLKGQGPRSRRRAKAQRSESGDFQSSELSD
jgi:hypothetical protein